MEERRNRAGGGEVRRGGSVKAGRGGKEKENARRKRGREKGRKTR